MEPRQIGYDEKITFARSVRLSGLALDDVGQRRECFFEVAIIGINGDGPHLGIPTPTQAKPILAHPQHRPLEAVDDPMSICAGKPHRTVQQNPDVLVGQSPQDGASGTNSVTPPAPWSVTTK